MKKKLLFLSVLILILSIGTAIYISAAGSSYTYRVRSFQGKIVDIEYSPEGILENAEPFYNEDGIPLITFTAQKPGSTDVIIKFASGVTDSNHFDVYTPFKIIVSEEGNIAGYSAVSVAVTLFFYVTAIYLFLHFRKLLKVNMYSYSTIQHCSAAVLCTVLGLLFTVLSVHIIVNFQWYDIQRIRNFVIMSMEFLVWSSIPFVAAFAAAMTFSNIMLIHREGFRPANALGIGISAVMFMGIAVLWILSGIGSVYLHLLFSVLFGFFECMLLGTMICGFIAAKHKPVYDKDYLIINGCGIRRDGSLFPLLQGRVDKAIEFCRTQADKTGKKAVFVPSGGQGGDEIISEGEAMKRYLLEQGIPEEQIQPEIESSTTLENMQFSKRITGDGTEKKIAFFTTNYHVFRVGILAGQAGIKNAEGMGSKTKWYFWPNAFIRELAGIILGHPKRFFVVLFAIAFFVAVLGSLLAI